ncbi:MAG: hypothetical protein ACEQSA_05880 [Weeksellaceae bacterium]
MTERLTSTEILESFKNSHTLELFRDQFQTTWEDKYRMYADSHVNLQFLQRHKYDPLITLDHHVRVFSEMTLCTTLDTPAMRQLLNLNCHLAVVKGSVEEQTGAITETHYYAIGPEGHIYCLTAGQFICPTEALGRGERIALMKAQAPQLVTVLDEELSLLHGSAQEIEAAFGLRYRARSQSY